VAEVLAEIDDLVGAPIDGWDIEAIKVAARREALRVAGLAVTRHLNADSSAHPGANLPCPRCATKARYAGRREKVFLTTLGQMRLSRAYYHCDHCQAGFCPRDRSLDLHDSYLSPHVQRMVGLVGARVSFDEGHDLLGNLAGIEVPTKEVEREAERLGKQIADDERRATDPDISGELPPTLYMGLDGTGIPMRTSELAGRCSKQPDGSSKCREVKLVTVWSAEAWDTEGVPVRDEGSVSYSAAIETAASRDTDKELSIFAQRVAREAARRRFE
jgi:hypothetical protein